MAKGKAQTPKPTEEVKETVQEQPTEEVKGVVNFEANDKSVHLKKGVVYSIHHTQAIRFEKKGFGKIIK